MSVPLNIEISASTIITKDPKFDMKLSVLVWLFVLFLCSNKGPLAGGGPCATHTRHMPHYGPDRYLPLSLLIHNGTLTRVCCWGARSGDMTLEPLPWHSGPTADGVGAECVSKVGTYITEGYNSCDHRCDHRCV